MKWNDFHRTLAQQEAFIQNNFSSFGLEYRYQYNSNCPLTYEEFTNKVAEIEFNLIIGNEQFDPSNRDEPIQRLISDQYYSRFSPKMNNYYTMFIGMNTYEIESSIFSSEKTGKFYTVSREKTYGAESFDTNYNIHDTDKSPTLVPF